MTFQPSIQDYSGSASIGSGNTQAVAAWSADRVYVADNGAGDFLVFALSTGTLVVSGASVGVRPPFSVDAAGYIYDQKSAANANGQNKIVGETLDFAGSWGTTSGSQPGNVGFPTNMASVSVGNASWLMGVTSAIDNAIWAVLGSVPNFGGLYFTYDETAARVCAGAPIEGGMTAFTLGFPNVPGVGPQQLGFYRTEISINAAGYDPTTWPTTNSEIATAKLVTIPVATIDATWTHVTDCTICCDETDGNVLIAVSTDNAVATTRYLMKLNGVTGAIMWQVPFVGYVAGKNQMGWSRIRHGRFCFFENTGHTLHTFDTSDGSSTTTTTGFAGVSMFAQCFDDTTGILFGVMNYGQTTGSPTPRGTTPSSFSGQWAALYAIEGFPNPAIPFATYSYTRIWGQKG